MRLPGQHSEAGVRYAAFGNIAKSIPINKMGHIHARIPNGVIERNQRIIARSELRQLGQTGPLAQDEPWTSRIIFSEPCLEAAHSLATKWNFGVVSNRGSNSRCPGRGAR